MKLAPMLLGDTLEERVYVWCRMAYLFSMEDDNNSNNNNNNKGNDTKQTRKTFDADSLMFFEGDIQLRRADVDFVLAPYYPTRELQEESLSAGRAYESVPRRSKRKVISPTLHWSGAVVPFILDEKQFNAEMNKDILHAISEWERLTCVRFTRVERGPRDSSHVVVFRKSDAGCSSPIGRHPGKDVEIRLSEGCIGPVIQHEIGHTLGMFHEQSRPDRDHYVEVTANNAKPIARGNFMRQRTSHTFGVPYDYTSVMHYADDDFSKAEGLKTIRTRDPDFQEVIGQRVSISFYDAKAINAAYCSRTCGFRSLEWAECKNGGYRNPNNCDECVCPEGLAPPFCEEVDEGINVDCGRQELTAKADEQVLTSPGFDSEAGMGKNTYCPWLITAATPGKRVHIRFVGRFNFYKNPLVGLCEDRVEVRYKTLYTPGPRFCTGVRTKKEYFSFGSQLLIGAQTLDYTSKWQGFQAIFKEENCGGCSSDAQKIEPLCYKEVDFTCQPDKFTSPYRTFSWFRPYAARRDLKCKRDEPFCCQGYKRSGEKCIRSTTPSSPETPTGKPETAPVTSTTVTPQTRPSPDTTTSTPQTRSATPETKTTTSEITTATPETKTTTSETTTATPEIKTTQDTTTVTPASSPNEPITTTASSKSPVPSSRKPAITTGQSTTAQPKTATLGFTFPPSNVWFPWGRWSPCSASCGLCGLRTRTRVCFRPPCQGHSKEKELCGVTECKEETITEEVSCQKVKKGCKKGWFSNVNKDCIVRSTCAISKTSQRCCHGEPDGGVCTIYFGKKRFPVFE